MKGILKISGLSMVMACSIISINGQGTMRVDGAAARIVCSGAPSVVLNNMHFANNASNTMLTAGNSEFRFVGNLSSNISSTGAFTTQFYNVETNKTGGAEIDVTTDNMTIITSNILEMVSGNVDMNNNLNSTWQLGTAVANLGTLTRTTGHFYRGFFRRWYAAGPGTDNAQWDIPVGMNAASYNFARVYHNNATAGGTLRTMFVPINPFYNGLPLLDNTNTAACGAAVNINNCADEGYWAVYLANGLDNVSPYTIKLCYNNFTTTGSEPCLRIIKSEDYVSWMQEGTHGMVDAVNNWVTRDGQTGFSFFTISGDSLVNPLPVEMISFNATCNQNAVNLAWVTASENDNSHFNLERSKDLSTWEFVAMINSQNGNSNVPQYYNYVDQSASGLNYYRLTQVDNNMNFHSFGPVSANCGGDGNGEVAIINSYDNGNGGVVVVVYTPTEMDYVISLMDLRGRKVSTSKGIAAPGNNTYTLDAGALRDGYYLVNIQIGDQNLSRKVFVK